MLEILLMAEGYSWPEKGQSDINTRYFDLFYITMYLMRIFIGAIS